MGENAYPEPTVGALIFNEQQQIILIRGKKFKDRYVVPGGHIEIGEEMEEALRREIREETGLEVCDIKLIGLQEAIFPEFHVKSKHFIYIDYVCRALPGEVKLNEESEEYIWTTLPEALVLPLETFTAGLIKEYLKGDGSEFRQTILYRINR